MVIPLEYPAFLLLIPLGLIAVWKLIRQKGAIGFSSVTLLKGIRTGPSPLVLERLFLSVFITSGILVLARPIQFVRNSVPVYQEARDITVALDISGSMMQNEKLKTAEKVISEFVAGRPADRVALFVFDTQAFLEWPLSPDHEALLFRLHNVVTGGGTAIASGLIAGLKHQQRYGQNSGAIVIVSDGISEVTAEEKSTIEAVLGQSKLYMVWIDSQQDDRDKKLALEFGDYVRSLGGKVYRGEIGELGEIFSEINKLEASPVVWKQQVTTVYHFGLLPLAALVSLLGAGLVNMIKEV